MPSPRSLRFQLPLTYAGIALLTALALGAVLILTLREYYRDQERAYLEGNAQAMRDVVARLVQAGLPAEALKAQIENLSFLTLARIRVLDTNGTLIVDSGVPDAIHITSLSREKGSTQIFVSAAPLPDSAPVAGGEGIDSGVIFVKGDVFQDGEAPVPNDRMVLPPKEGEFAVPVDGGPGEVIGFVAPLGQSFYGYDLSSPVAEVSRSDEAIMISLITLEGELVGSLQLSDGQEYGRKIVESVALAWATAGLLAVILAAGAGWLVSRRMAAPVLALTTITKRMAEGDLSVRTAVAAPEELAALGRSFNEMAAQIEEMVSTLRNFVSDAAHELHTPLTALQTDLELARETAASALIERALTQTERLKELVDNLLDLSRIESREHPHTTVSLSGLVCQLAEVYASRAEQAGLSFTLDNVDEAQVEGNETQLRSAIGNLLENALKFTPEGGQIRLALEKDGEGWRVQVADSGIGIPPEEIPLLFKRFHRARNVASFPGNGLGLAIVKAIADAHQGRVHAENISGENLSPGAQFSLWLPMSA